ncbi:MAG: sigma-70 family RNA polymerase sigma factor [Clostridia bacterium]|nr:sigma-70 family RNA polymerase sigma factor [Clostridia bacterium]
MSNVMGPDNALNREQKLEQLVDRYQTPLLHMCYLYLCDKSLAEDAVQEIFLKVYRNLDRFRGESSEKTWIMRIAMNTCYSINHSGWFRFFNRNITPEMMPDKAAQTDGDDRQLVVAVTRLPQKMREVILLHYFQGMKVNEIAETLGISQSSVSGRLKRGRDRLKTMLDGRNLDE